MQTVTVIGGGSWGTALVKILSEKKIKIHWWVRQNETVQFILKNHKNPSYLTDVIIDMEKVSVFDSVKEAVKNSDLVVLVVPSAFLRLAIEPLTPSDLKDKIIFNAIKGIVPQRNQIVCEFMRDVYNLPLTSLGVISGPCHAEEVALEKLSYLTISCQQLSNARELSQLLECFYIKTNLSNDIYGTEYNAILKNIYAITSGIAHSLHYGDNFQAVLISNAIQEIKRFIDNVHPIKRDIKGSAYLGDLLVTAYSQFSRNRTFGSMIGKGYSVKATMAEMNMVAEGYFALKCIHEINKKYKVEMPICDATYNIIYERISPSVEFKLMTEKLV